MYFLGGLVVSFGLMWLLSILGITALSSTHMQGTYAAGIMFILAGIMHFVKRREFVKMMPKGIWNKQMTNWFVGAAEIALGLALFFKDYRTMAAYALIMLLILVFPANITLANNKSTAYNVSRLFFQPLYIFWVYWFCIYHTW